MRPSHISADHKLLSPILAVFNPCACTLSRLIQAVFTFPDDTFRLLLAHSSSSGRHLRWERRERTLLQRNSRARLHNNSSAPNRPQIETTGLLSSARRAKRDISRVGEPPGSPGKVGGSGGTRTR